ncbi:MAG: hypothetical protein LBI06_08425 [Treponema sp.]|jgi:hypothetical protein|nr:hypothetical protein [Treponema sp.]
MRKRVLPHILWFLLINCMIFMLLAAMQFTGSGNFPQKPSEPVAIIEQKKFDPADFVIPQAETAQAFSDALTRWITRIFASWTPMAPQPNEDTVIAWNAEAIRRGSYRSAVSAIPVGFSTSPQRTWESAVYQFDRRTGVWERAVRAIGVFEREKLSRINGLLANKELGLFSEDRLIEFLALRGQSTVLDNILSFAQTLDPSTLTLKTGLEILEHSLEMDKWHPSAANPFEAFTPEILRIVADNLHRIDDQTFVFSSGLADTELNLRLGKALNKWGEKSGETAWAGVGRSLLFSVISLNEGNSVPASLRIDSDTTPEEGGIFFPSAEQIGSARLYRLLNENKNLPHATAAGTGGMWTWTATSSVNVTQSENQMTISVEFPVGETHYVMLRNVRPFYVLQIYDMNWRSAVDFESYYDSSGWYYFEQERTLVIKIRQRSNVENIRINFTAPRPVQAPEPPQEQQE